LSALIVLPSNPFVANAAAQALGAAESASRAGAPGQAASAAGAAANAPVPLALTPQTFAAPLTLQAFAAPAALQPFAAPSALARPAASPSAALAAPLGDAPRGAAAKAAPAASAETVQKGRSIEERIGSSSIAPGERTEAEAPADWRRWLNEGRSEKTGPEDTSGFAAVLPKADGTKLVRSGLKPASPRLSWKRSAQTLTGLGMIAFLAIHVPQIDSNIHSLFAGDPAQLASLPWIAYTLGIFSNMLLLFDFVAKKPAVAAGKTLLARSFQRVSNRIDALTQLSAVVTASAVLGTLYAAHQLVSPDSAAAALLMPGWAFWSVTPLLLGGLGAAALKWRGKIGDRTWEKVKRGTELLVFGSLVQAFATLLTGSFSLLLPGAIAAAAGLALLGLEKSGRLPAWLPQSLRWEKIAFWTRLGVAAYGLPALAIQNWAHPENIAGISLKSILLGMWGNLLSLPQSIQDQNKVWIFNSVWGGAAGSGLVLALMWYFGAVGLAAFGGIGAAAAAFIAFTLWKSR
jgi:hypothetical protein